MFLLILDKNPYKAAMLIPDRLKFKQLLELGQLICSAGISDVFKPIKQGKELQEWVKNNKQWTFKYFTALFTWVQECLTLKPETIIKLSKIHNDLYKKMCWYDRPKTAIFRYVKEYAGMTEYESNSELPIDVAINEYKRYVEWKEKQFNSKCNYQILESEWKEVRNERNIN